MGQCHAMAEFWVDNIGWIPVDATSALDKSEAEGMNYFGRFNADLLVFHYGIDLPIVEPGGQHFLSVVQAPAIYVYTFQPDQSLDGVTTDGTWQVGP